MDLKLSNKIAIVLAASKGLGKAIATTLANEGATVVISSRNIDQLNEAAAEIEKLTRREVTCIAADVSNPADIESLIRQTVDKFGTIDILINNTGGPPFDKFENFNDEAWKKAFDDILLAFARNSRLALPYLKKSDTGGRIINIVSGSIKSVLENSVLSTAMRMGVVGMAKLMADEFGPYNITVNNVAPGLILTDRIKHTLPKDVNPDEAIKQKTKSIPLGRIGKPEEFAAAVAFLASEQASYISGVTLQVDGGASRAIY
ncbi:SDR family oxidoreductase [Mucilaginibacter polytrichastri]|uniref:3-oxoacyl-reductase FabG n=1 Tax=Mucilaginibacter polytrichastri TaxID=1302689 RepID=A0A1Q6A3B7_9SPHI|nr:SDR family oxidoreductase [Mucilaginibacter polytrichastri]OKS88499.1 3-oxoacyl- reductase FabG [Mucilaginibacter polytrichastri]SFT12026.1 3-oxoacyl-[acyl-carrier protein] reductase [Mucilaginibacter polytrichastri]